MSINNSTPTDTFLPFHLNSFWEEYYKSGEISNFSDWYFDITTLKTVEFDIYSWDRNYEIIILGVGNSRLIDLLISYKFMHVTLVDFSSTLMNYLKKKYENIKECSEWDCRNIYLY